MSQTFDVNILANPFEEPAIKLTFPLPTDKESYVKLDGNSKTANSFRILQLFLSLVSGVDIDKIYTPVNEYKYSIHKYSAEFKKKFKDYMDDRLEKSDQKLNDLVYDMVNQELRLNLIKAGDFNDRFVKIKEFMIKYYKANNEKNLPTWSSELSLRISYLTTIKLFQKMYPHGIWVSRIDFERLYKQYLDNPMSIIYLPNHQSHVDYMIMHVIAVRFQMAIPSVIAGENLNVAIFGKILRNLGAIFIPRSFNNELYTERNLANVMEFILLNHIPIEVFIEGTRSRDGKLLLPKYGILKSFVNIYLKQRLEDKNPNFDLLMQPVSITYERIYEADSFLDELIGKDKIKESFVGILSSGVKNLIGDKTEQPYVIDKQGFNDNSERDLSGKLYVKLGEAFKLSDYVANDDYSFADEVNIKKLGFKVLHEVNRTAFIPKVAVVGTALQFYYYKNLPNTNKSSEPKLIKIEDLLPDLKMVIKILDREVKLDPINSVQFGELSQLNDSQLTDLVKSSIKPFFRYISINDKTNTIRVTNSIELLYYKNITIHLVIVRCLICNILAVLVKQNKANYNMINRLYYILTGLLKVEFLFDYNYDERSQLSFILEDLTSMNVIRQEESGLYTIVDQEYVLELGNVVSPFLQSYINLITQLGTYKPPKKIEPVQDKKTKKLIPIDKEELVYPTTKTLLKHVIKNSQDKSIESFNKQYLVSDLYYLNHLELVQIFKNKAKTKAFVKILQQKDLNVLNDFLKHMVRKDYVAEDIHVNYLADIINKNSIRHRKPKL
jgi:hypothetical protein